MFEPRVKLGHNMFSLSDEMVNNSSFVNVLPFWTKRLLDAFCGNSQTWHQGRFPSTNIPDQMERLSSHRALFAISLLAWTLLQVLGFFPFFTSKFQCNQKCLGTRLNKCLRTLKCFVDKQITIFTFVFFRQKWPKNKVPLSVINQQIKSPCTNLLT